MLALLFQIEEVFYAVRSDSVREVVPLADLKQDPGLLKYSLGLLNYRRTIIPVFDMCLLMRGRQCKNRLSTRIILVEVGSDEESKLIGIAAERVTETIHEKDEVFEDKNSTRGKFPFLGSVFMRNKQMIQVIDTRRLNNYLNMSSFWEKKDENGSESN